LITLDTWRADHWTADRSPALWALATDGERYTAAYAPIGLTSPSHATMLTGRMPWEHGMEANNHHGYTLSPAVQTLAEAHPDWDTAAFVSAYPAGPNGGLSRGFRRFDAPEAGERPGEAAVAGATEWLGDHAPTEGGLLWVHLYEPHGPYVGEGQTDTERYAEEVRRADGLLAPLIQALRARGATIVVAADHGEVLLEETCGRQHERSASEAVLRVPLLRWAPGRAPRVDGGLRSLADVPALLAGDDPPPRPYIIAESGLCEPACAPGCSPPGLQGRDRLIIGPAGRVRSRPGVGIQVEGEPPVGVEAAAALLAALPPVPAPGSPEEAEALRLLGYTPSPAGSGAAPNKAD
jgi:hypothetical protein